MSKQDGCARQSRWGSPFCAADNVLPAVLLWIGLFSHSLLLVRLRGSQKNTGNVIAHYTDIAVGSERSICLKRQYDSQPFVKVVPNA